MDRSGTQMVWGIERRQEHLRPWRTSEATPEKVTEGVMMNTSKVNESAPMIVRVAQGSLMAGHGAQKLFGSFGGPGLEGTSGFMEMLGMRPGRP
jgi:DoxX